MDKDLDLNTSADLPLCTDSNAGGYGASAAQLRTGFIDMNDPADPAWLDDPNSPTVVGDTRTRVADEPGGVCGRPHGMQR